MPGDASLDIRIETPGAEDASHEVQALRGEIAKLRRELEELRGAHQKGTGHARQHAEQHKALHKIMHDLNHVVPGLGLALKAAFSPQTLGLAVAVEAVHQLAQAFGKMMEKIKEMKAEQAGIQVKILTDQADALLKSKEYAYEYAKAMKDVKLVADQIKQTEADTLEILKHQAAARGHVLGGTPGTDAALAGQASGQEIEVKRKAWWTSVMQLGAARTTMDEAQAARAGQGQGTPTAAAAARASVEMARLEKELKEAQAKVKKDVPNASVSAYAGGPGAAAFGGFFAAFAPSDPNVRKRDEAAEELNKAKRAIAEHNLAVKKLEDAYAKAEAEYKALAASVEQRRHDLDQASKTRTIDQGGEAAVRAGKARTFIPESRAGITFLNAIQGEVAAGLHQHMSGEQEKAVNSVLTALRAIGKSNKQINNILAMMMGDSLTQEQKMNELFGLFKQLKGQTSGRNLNVGGQ